MNHRRALTAFGLVLIVCTLLDSAPSTAAAPPGRYTLTSDTVYDTKTKLTWQREVPATGYSWADAKAYCAALSLDGAGWRLPNMKELQTIVDVTRSEPAIDEIAFPNTPTQEFWSSSLVANPLCQWSCPLDRLFSLVLKRRSFLGVDRVMLECLNIAKFSNRRSCSG